VKEKRYEDLYQERVSLTSTRIISVHIKSELTKREDKRTKEKSKLNKYVHLVELPTLPNLLCITGFKDFIAIRFC
jgi:hypothetical protein